MKFGRAAAIRWTTFFDMLLLVLRSTEMHRLPWRTVLIVRTRYGVEGYRLGESETSTQRNNPMRTTGQLIFRSTSFERSLSSPFESYAVSAKYQSPDTRFSTL